MGKGVTLFKRSSFLELKTFRDCPHGSKSHKTLINLVHQIIVEPCQYKEQFQGAVRSIYFQARQFLIPTLNLWLMDGRDGKNVNGKIGPGSVSFSRTYLQGISSSLFVVCCLQPNILVKTKLPLFIMIISTLIPRLSNSESSYFRLCYCGFEPRFMQDLDPGFLAV